MRTAKVWARISPIGALFVLLTACGGGAVQQAGFLTNYAQLQPDTTIEGALAYRAPNLYSYRKFMLDPVVVHFAPKDEGTAIDPGKVKELTDYFHDQTVKALSKNYLVVDRPASGVLRLRIAITKIVETTPLLNVHPAMKLTGAGLGGASMEAEAIDSVTNKRVAAIVETASGRRLSVGVGLSTLGHAKQVIDGWVERFVKRLDAERAGKKG
jgi:hypothetical protein